MCIIVLMYHSNSPHFHIQTTFQFDPSSFEVADSLWIEVISSLYKNNVDVTNLKKKSKAKFPQLLSKSLLIMPYNAPPTKKHWMLIAIVGLDRLGEVPIKIYTLDSRGRARISEDHKEHIKWWLMAMSGKWDIELIYYHLNLPAQPDAWSCGNRVNMVSAVLPLFLKPLQQMTEDDVDEVNRLKLLEDLFTKSDFDGWMEDSKRLCRDFIKNQRRIWRQKRPDFGGNGEHQTESEVVYVGSSKSPTAVQGQMVKMVQSQTMTAHSNSSSNNSNNVPSQTQSNTASVAAKPHCLQSADAPPEGMEVESTESNVHSNESKLESSGPHNEAVNGMDVDDENTKPDDLSRVLPPSPSTPSRTESSEQKSNGQSVEHIPSSTPKQTRDMMEMEDDGLVNSNSHSSTTDSHSGGASTDESADRSSNSHSSTTAASSSGSYKPRPQEPPVRNPEIDRVPQTTSDSTSDPTNASTNPFGPQSGAVAVPPNAVLKPTDPDYVGHGYFGQHQVLSTGEFVSYMPIWRNDGELMTQLHIRRNPNAANSSLSQTHLYNQCEAFDRARPCKLILNKSGDQRLVFTVGEYDDILFNVFPLTPVALQLPSIWHITCITQQNFLIRNRSMDMGDFMPSYRMLGNTVLQAIIRVDATGLAEAGTVALSPVDMLTNLWVPPHQLNLDIQYPAYSHSDTKEWIKQRVQRALNLVHKLQIGAFPPPSGDLWLFAGMCTVILLNICQVGSLMGGNFDLLGAWLQQHELKEMAQGLLMAMHFMYHLHGDLLGETCILYKMERAIEHWIPLLNCSDFVTVKDLKNHYAVAKFLWQNSTNQAQCRQRANVQYARGSRGHRRLRGGEGIETASSVSSENLSSLCNIMNNAQLSFNAEEPFVDMEQMGTMLGTVIELTVFLKNSLGRLDGGRRVPLDQTDASLLCMMQLCRFDTVSCLESPYV